MQTRPEAADAHHEKLQENSSGRRAFRVSEPDGDSNRFLIALGADASGHPPSSDDDGAFAREGA